jgi:hypothetical protein
MGRGTTRRPKPKERSGPSLFFIIALLIGIALLIWVFARTIGKPVAKRGYNAGAIRAAMTA